MICRLYYPRKFIIVTDNVNRSDYLSVDLHVFDNALIRCLVRCTSLPCCVWGRMLSVYNWLNAAKLYLIVYNLVCGFNLYKYISFCMFKGTQLGNKKTSHVKHSRCSKKTLIDETYYFDCMRFMNAFRTQQLMVVVSFCIAEFYLRVA